MLNLDTSTGIAFISENSPIRAQLRQYVQGQQMVMTQTAFNEFTNIEAIAKLNEHLLSCGYAEWLAE